jgi:hypothetical protein
LAEHLVDVLLNEVKYDPDEVAMGIEVEKEHTKDPKEAEKIAKDHLREPGNSRYYSKMKKCGLTKEHDVKPKPKAEIMPGGGMSEVGDTLGLGIAGGGGV